MSKKIDANVMKFQNERKAMECLYIIIMYIYIYIYNKVS